MVHLSSRECCLKQLPELLRDLQRNLSYLKLFMLDMRREYLYVDRR